MKNEKVTLQLSVEEFKWLEKIWSSRVRLGENILTRYEESDLPPNFHDNFDIDKSILNEIERIKNET
ncbi:hypothetical protein GAP32_450 [Cronobacter phage vB_CsaM_GAP32]|uniref:Uncharacterized protein n=1 Tax=Cronobacter phage vB_CsaM_GAP32 TaxID=1141136 RepID=K4F6L3_9CAUD|nr:hypothetical protein GAP32_450 [Cronobacter phage vB_CsaM_GAP32]AFC21906.1 hypothetical protein GAP32_450 [Cronobacter phage vB_CsaM_GAP32]